MLDGDRPLLEFVLMVKDGAPTVAKVLAAVQPYVDHWTVLDTGSTDGTQDIIRAGMEGVPGCLYEEPFVRFDISRNRALELAGDHCVFTLMLDDSFVLSDGAALRSFLTSFRAGQQRGFNLSLHYGALIALQPWILRTRSQCRYQCPCHETIRPSLADNVPVAVCSLSDISSPVLQARSSKRREADALALRGHWESDNCTRCLFYWAETLYLLKLYSQAYSTYEKYCQQPQAWAQQVYMARLRQAESLDHLESERVQGGAEKKTEAQQIANWERQSLPLLMAAIRADPERLEAYCVVGKHYQFQSKQYPLAHAFFQLGVDRLNAPSEKKLFDNVSVREWELPFNYLVSCTWLRAAYTKGVQFAQAYDFSSDAFRQGHWQRVLGQCQRYARGDFARVVVSEVPLQTAAAVSDTPKERSETPSVFDSLPGSGNGLLPTLASLPPILWINLDRSEERRKKMLALFTRLHIQTHHRVVAYDGLGPLDDIKSILSARMIEHIERTKIDWKVVACTLSHMRAIRQAWEIGEEWSIIVEDDLVFEPDKWDRPLLSYLCDREIDEADIVQLGHQGPHLSKNLEANGKGILQVPWHLKNYGAYAFAIRRKGIAKLISAYLDEETKVWDWLHVGNNTGYACTADSVLFQVGSTLTSTIPWMLCTGDDSTLHPEHLAAHCRSFELIREWYDKPDKAFWTNPVSSLPKLAVVITGRNTARYVVRCLSSVLQQKYPPSLIRILWGDDASTDDSVSEATTTLKNSDMECILYTAKEQGYACKLRYEMLQKVKPDEIVVLLDGDDCLYSEHALSIVALAYQNPDIWVAFGGMQQGEVGKCADWGDYPSDGTFRGRWYAAHVRTFRRPLLDHVSVTEMKDKDGEWFRQATDVALMTPILELAGKAHILHFTDLYSGCLYHYTVEPNIQYSKSRVQAQRTTALEIYARASYTALNTLEERFLVLKGVAGFADRLMTLSKAVQLCRQTGRTLVIDWSDSSWNHEQPTKGFFHYLGLAEIPQVKILASEEENEAFYRKYGDCDSVLPTAWIGQLERVDYKLIGGILCLDKNNIRMNRDHILTATQHIVVYIDYCAGNIMDIVPFLTFKSDNPKSREIFDIGVHFRNTDKISSIDACIDRVRAVWRPGLRVFLATDDSEAPPFFVSVFGEDLTFHRPPPKPKVGGIHHQSKAQLSTYSTSKEKLNEAMFEDLRSLTNSKTFIGTETSLFTRLVECLRNKVSPPPKSTNTIKIQ